MSLVFPYTSISGGKGKKEFLTTNFSHKRFPMLVINFYQLSLIAIKGDPRCIKINQQEYELGIKE